MGVHLDSAEKVVEAIAEKSQVNMPFEVQHPVDAVEGYSLVAGMEKYVPYEPSHALSLQRYSQIGSEVGCRFFASHCPFLSYQAFLENDFFIVSQAPYFSIDISYGSHSRHFIAALLTTSRRL